MSVCVGFGLSGVQWRFGVVASEAIMRMALHSVMKRQIVKC